MPRTRAKPRPRAGDENGTLTLAECVREALPRMSAKGRAAMERLIAGEYAEGGNRPEPQTAPHAHQEERQP